MLGSLIIFLKGMRRMMFQLSGFYYIPSLKAPCLFHTSSTMPRRRLMLQRSRPGRRILTGLGSRVLGVMVWV